MNIEISPKEYERELNWYDANLYCQLLTIDNKNDWRLPTKEELKDIWKNKNDFYNFAQFWSSTEANNNTVWVYMLDTGYPFTDDKDSYCHVRAVRTI